MRAEREKIAVPGGDPALEALARVAATACGRTTGVVLWFGSPVFYRAGPEPAPDLPSVAAEVLRTSAPVLTEDVGAVPLLEDDGAVAGALVVAGGPPHQLTPSEVASLHEVAAAILVLTRERRDTSRESLRHRQFVADLPIGFVVTSLEGEVLDVNPEFCQLMGRSREELVGTVGMSYGRLSDMTHISDELADLCAGRRRHVRASRTYVQPGGRSVSVVVTTVLTHDQRGVPDGFLAYVIDDTAGAEGRAQLADANEQLAHRQDFLDNVLETLDVGLVAVDGSGRITLWNSAVVSLRSFPGAVWDPADFGTDRQPPLYDASGTRPLGPDELPLVRALRGEAVEQQEVVVRADDEQYRRLLADGRQVRAADGTVLGAVVVLTDLSAALDAQRRLEASEERFRLGFQSSPIGMVLLDADRRIVEVNQSVAVMTGYPAEQLLGRSVEDFVRPEDLGEARRNREVVDARDVLHWGAERQYLAADGRLVTFRISMARLPSSGDQPLLLAQIEDVTEQRAAERRLADSALYDGLTGLPNRALFTDRVEQALFRSDRSSKPFAIMFCDLDGFKLVNDALGHAAGDDVLRLVATRMQAAVRSSDTVARLGGDEFVILCEDSDDELTRQLAHRVEAALQTPIPVQGDEVLVTTSIGVAIYRPGTDWTTVDSLLHDADTAMYRAKTTGKNRHSVYDAALRAEADARKGTENVLRRRLLEDGIEVHYQPVVDLATGEVVGVEALCRLRDDDGAHVSPLVFVGVAEDAGLISALGERVLRAAIAQTAYWNANGHPHLHVAVNVSARQAGHDNYAAHVLALIRAAGLPAENLVLELTESVLIEATVQTVRQLSELRSAGVGVAIDDFGTQYASLRYVQRLPLSALKIDMSFTTGLPGGRQEQAIIESVAQLAASLDLACIAEGIETREQLDILAALGVWGQGYYLGRPVPASELDLTPRTLRD
jgi:diguanylate cyclase (GGDEF)-like protein/PAS domain S-box-containing protein